MDLRIGLPEASRRVFWARHYARRRLLSEHAAPFAPAHYALIGEGLGYRPNGFFDPHYFRERASSAGASRGLLAAYLAGPEEECAAAFGRIRPRLVHVAEPGLEPQSSAPVLALSQRGMLWGSVRGRIST